MPFDGVMGDGPPWDLLSHVMKKLIGKKLKAENREEVVSVAHKIVLEHRDSILLNYAFGFRKAICE